MTRPRTNKTLKHVPRRDPEPQWSRAWYCRIYLYELGILSSRESAMLRKRCEKKFPDVFTPLALCQRTKTRKR
jgi:hypothetical protein